MMILDLKNLPTDQALLHQIIIDLVASLTSEREKLAAQREELVLLRAKLYGTSSEKINRQIDELEQKIEETEAKVAETASQLEDNNDSGENSGDQEEGEEATEVQPKNKPKRKKLPDHLERQEVILSHDPICPSCGGKNFRTISNDCSETLEYIPSSFKVISYIRPRCACINCETIVQSYPPAAVIDKGKAGPGLLAHILVQKYCNHLPFYRQSQMYAREDIELSRSTMASWAGQCSRLLNPLIKSLKQEIFASAVIHGDDTPIKVLAPGTGKTKTGRLWTYVRDGRGCGDPTPPAVCYFYSPDRKGERPASHLKEFTGILHADAYSGYDKIYQLDENGDSKISEAACWAHTRRKFYEVTVGNTPANIANKSLEQIGNIYQIEEEIRGHGADDRKTVRQARSKAILIKLFSDWQKDYTVLPKKSPTAQAIAYAMNNKVALMRFLEDGRIEIDNNVAERAMRGIALGRKNWLFAGSDEGGETAANLYSLIETAKLNDINPWKYLATVLERIQNHNSSKIAELLPWNLKLK